MRPLISVGPVLGERRAGTAREIAPEVFWLRLPGRTQTNVYFIGSSAAWVLIDAGWHGDAPRIHRAAELLFGPGSRPAGVLLTHCHPDHSGAAAHLAGVWDCPIFLHPSELPIAAGDFAAMVNFAGPLDRWVVLPLMRALGQRRREALLTRSGLGELARIIQPGSSAPGLPGWQSIPTPGHTPGHLSYFRPADRVLISGDALVTMRVNSPAGLLLQRPGLSAPPWYTTWDRQEAMQSIERLAGLRPSVLAGGHGEPMTSAATAALLRAFAREVRK